MTYRDQLYIQMKRQQRRFQVFGWLLIIPSTFSMSIVIYSVREWLLTNMRTFDYRVLIVCLSFTLLFTMSVILVWYGFNYRNAVLRKYPEIEALIDEIDNAILYKDDEIIISENAIVPCKRLEYAVNRKSIKSVRLLGRVYGQDAFSKTVQIKTAKRTVSFQTLNSARIRRILFQYCGIKVNNGNKTGKD